MKLSKYQIKALGADTQQVPDYVWNPHLSKIYEKIDRKNKQMEEDGQTYHDFLQMEKREPNEEGTGRYKFEAISKIQYFFISKGVKKTTYSLLIRQKISRLLNIYLRLPTEYNENIHISLKGNRLIDQQKGLEYFIKQEEAGLDVYDLLDVLMEYRQDGTILVGLIESGLQQDEAQLDGRACGDGVAVVGFKRSDLDKHLDQLLQTVLHETLHTLGFDHCIAWKCLMNAWTNFQAWLCPACSRKLYHELKIESRIDAFQWVKGVTGMMEEMKSYENAKKGRNMMKNLSQYDI